jgi:glycosyltransferase involved in cell wall biosynthesis
LDSILAQTFTDYELILIDDGSTDDSPMICEEYSSRSNRIKVIHQTNAGVVRARKAGARIADGKYIGCVDSDDWIEKEMYESLCTAAKETTADVVVCNYFVNFVRASRPVASSVFKPGFYVGDRYGEHILGRILCDEKRSRFDNLPTLWNKIIRSDLFKAEIALVDDRMLRGEDAACSYGCLASAESLYYVDKYLYHYRQHEGSAMKKVGFDNYALTLLFHSHLLELSMRCRSYDLSADVNSLFLFLAWLGSRSNKEILARKEVRQALKNEPFSGACFWWKKQLLLMRLGTKLS